MTETNAVIRLNAKNLSFLISIYALVKEAGGSDLNILKSNYKNIKVKEKKVLIFGQIHSFPVVEVSH